MTAQDICNKYKFSLSRLSQIKRKLDLNINKIADKAIRFDVYTNEDLKMIDEYMKTRCIPNKNSDLEKLRKEHPLVTDDRFFKTHFFPSCIPTNLEDLYNEEVESNK